MSQLIWRILTVQVLVILTLTVSFALSHHCSLLMPCLLLMPLPSFVYLENQSPWLPSSLHTTPSHLLLHLTLSPIISMENSHLLSPLVGRILLLPMPVSSYSHVLPLPALILIDLFSLSVHCHQERPLDINIHCFSIALLPCI